MLFDEIVLHQQQRTVQMHSFREKYFCPLDNYVEITKLSRWLTPRLGEKCIHFSQKKYFSYKNYIKYSSNLENLEF